MQNKSRTQYSILNMFTGFLGFILSAVAAYACRMIFVRTLSEQYLGLTGLLQNFLSMLSLAELGIGSAITYSLYKPIANDDREKIATLMHAFKIAYRIIGLIVAIAGIASIPFLNFVVKDTSGIKENIYLIYGIYLFNTASSYFFSFRGTLIYAYQRDYIVSGIGYATAILQNILQIIVLLAFSSSSFIPYIIVMSASVWTSNILVTIYAKKHFPFAEKKNTAPLAKEERWKIIKNVKAIITYKISGLLVNNTDNLVITYFSGLGITGLASNYALLMTTLDGLLKNVFNSLTASIGNLNAVESEEKKYNFFNVINLANFWMFGWVAIGIAFVSSDVIKLFFGDNYVMDISIPIMLGINMYMVGMQNAIWTYKNTMGLFKYGQYILFVTAALNLIGDIILGKYLGVFGIYLASALARLFTNTWYEPFALFKFGFKKSPIIYFKKYALFLLLLVLAAGFSWFSCSFIQINSWLNVILKILICSVVPNGIFWLAFHRTEEYRYLKDLVIRVFSMIKAKLLKRRQAN